MTTQVVIKIFDKQEAEITLDEIHGEGWVLSEFIEIQEAMGRLCVTVDEPIRSNNHED